MASIRFEVTDPLGVGINGTWRSLGTVTSSTFPELASIPRGGDATVYVDWEPRVTLTEDEIRATRFAFHSCLRVIATPVGGERVLTNLDGDGEQENISYFEVGAGRSSGGRTTESSFRLSNQRDQNDPKARTYYFLVDTDLPEGWGYEIAGGAESVTLAAGESRDIPVKIVSEGDYEAGQSWHLLVVAYSMELATPPSYVKMDRLDYHPKIAGGVDFAAQAVEETKIVLNAKQQGSIVVDGRLDPPVAKAQLTIDYTLANGDIESHLVVTDSNGAFHDATMKAETDVSTVRAFWQGNTKLSSVVSDLVTPKRASLIEWWQFIGIVLVALLLLVFFSIFRKGIRKT